VSNPVVENGLFWTSTEISKNSKDLFLQGVQTKKTPAKRPSKTVLENRKKRMKKVDFFRGERKNNG
jgi:hypothetical protein